MLSISTSADEHDRFLLLLGGVLDAMRDEPMFREAILHRDLTSSCRYMLYETSIIKSESARDQPTPVGTAKARQSLREGPQPRCIGGLGPAPGSDAPPLLPSGCRRKSLHLRRSRVIFCIWSTAASSVGTSSIGSSPKRTSGRCPPKADIEA